MEYDNREPSAKQQIRSLLGVILSAVIGAFLIAGFFLYYYSPSGKYLVHNALIDPQLVDKLAFNDMNPTTGAMDRYVFDGIVFSYYDPAGKKWQQMKIGPDVYRKFYDTIQQDTSMLEMPKEVPMLFNQENIAKLIVQVRTESHAAWQDNTKPFQQMHILPVGGYYRIELRESNPANKWVYFHHPGLYQEAMTLFQ